MCTSLPIRFTSKRLGNILARGTDIELGHAYRKYEGFGRNDQTKRINN